jgi:hypothetical protein
MKCDFCEFEDNVSKLNKYGRPDGWINVIIDNRYNPLYACTKCARIIMLCTNTSNPEVLKNYFPNLKRKDNNDE